jgi:Big-like domain-containing protein
MKKHLFIFVCMLVGLVFLIGCNNLNNRISNTVNENTSTETAIKETISSQSTDTTDWKTTTYETVNNFSGVTMTVKKGTSSANGLTVVFQNKSDNMCMYGNSFVLEQKINEKWYQVPDVLNGDYAFNAIGYEVATGQDKEWEVDWKWLFDSLNTGEYRIVKDVSDFRKTGDYDTYFLTAEFSITN